MKFGGLILNTNISKLIQGFFKIFITFCFNTFIIFLKWIFYSKTFFIDIIQSWYKNIFSKFKTNVRKKEIINASFMRKQLHITETHPGSNSQLVYYYIQKNIMSNMKIWVTSTYLYICLWMLSWRWGWRPGNCRVLLRRRFRWLWKLNSFELIKIYKDILFNYSYIIYL